MTARSRILDTPLMALVARGANDAGAVFNPMTDAMDTTLVRRVQFAWWLNHDAVSVSAGIQFSNDGVSWTEAAITWGAAGSSATGWTNGPAYQDIFALTGTKRLFCRFGLMAFNTPASTTGCGAQARLQLSLRPVVGWTVRAPMARVGCWLVGQTPRFNPLTDWMPAGDVGEVRATWELAASTGDLSARPGYQLANNLDETSGWSTPTGFGTSATAEGVTFGTDFDAVSWTQKYVRFGILGAHTSGSLTRACRASLRVDARN